MNATQVGAFQPQRRMRSVNRLKPHTKKVVPYGLAPSARDVLERVTDRPELGAWSDIRPDLNRRPLRFLNEALFVVHYFALRGGKEE